MHEEPHIKIFPGFAQQCYVKYLEKSSVRQQSNSYLLVVKFETELLSIMGCHT